MGTRTFAIPNEFESFGMVFGRKKNKSASAASRTSAEHQERGDADFSKLDEENAADAASEGEQESEKNDMEDVSGEAVSETIETATDENLGDSDSEDPRDEEIAKLRAEVEDAKDKYLRTLADFENYKKRTLKERSELLKYQGEKVFGDILSIVDNFELALHHKDADPETVRTGVELIYKMLVDILGRWEVRAESGLGKEFDPNKFAAISKIPVNDAKPGTIVNELKKAYFYKDKLLRPGEVVVAAEATKESSPSESESGE